MTVKKAHLTEFISLLGPQKVDHINRALKFALDIP